MRNHSDIDSDSDQQELVDNLMERQCYSIIKRNYSKSNSSSEEKGKKVLKSPPKEEKVEKKEKKVEKKVEKK